MACSGMPCACAERAITLASTNWLRAAPPVRISRGATPRSYSCTPSVTRANCAGVGLPSLSAGEPSTMMASKRVSAVLETGASRRATTPQASRPTTNTSAASVSRPRQPMRRRAGVRRWPSRRAGVLRMVRALVKATLSYHCNAAVTLGAPGPAFGTWETRNPTRLVGSPQISRCSPFFQNELAQGLASARRNLLSNQILLDQGGGFALVAERDDSAEMVVVWNLKDQAGGGVVEAGHGVSPESERAGLQHQRPGGRAQIVERVSVGGAVVAERGARHT